MRGYFGGNYGCGRGRGYGPNRPGNRSGRVREPEGFAYLGPCRCGLGPNAFWQEKESGRVSRGFPGAYVGRDYYPDFGRRRGEPAQEDLRSELDRLKQEKEEMERRIRDLEAKLQAKETPDAR
jgi:hypothetical protein